ncbi:MAG TPA: cytochrome c oxidase assembly protein [Fodinibius sp.]|nr:cytochrome c oxidase assembly protein [Fodinibius sp.]
MELFEYAAWYEAPAFWLIGLLLMGLHWRLTHYRIGAKTMLFAMGIILTGIALALPVGPAQGQSLFSMHMIRHILLLMLAPPFLVSGLPKKPIQKLFSKQGTHSISHILLYPLVTWSLGIGLMWFWHAPFIFNKMAGYSGSVSISIFLHTVEIGSLLAVGILFCSPIVFPLDKYRLPPLRGIVYLFTACWGCSILGILITFAPAGLYHTAFSTGSVTIWGLTQEGDQQLGGLLMWVPGCIIYVSGAMVLLARWYSQSKPASQSTHHKTSDLQSPTSNL